MGPQPNGAVLAVLSSPAEIGAVAVSLEDDPTATRSSMSTPLINPSILRKTVAEFVGTFIIIFSSAAGPIVNQKYSGAETLIGNAACAGLAVMVTVLSTGHISGAHLNPAVTVAFTALRHFPLVQVPLYISAQLAGSLCAAFLLKWAYHPFMSGGVTASSVGVAEAFVLEFVATFFLMFVITAVATDTRAVGELAGIAIGGTVMLDILIVGPATGASMNPVRSLGPAIASGNYRRIWIYLVAPILGAVSGAFIYTNIKPDEANGKSEQPQPQAPQPQRRKSFSR